MAQYELLQSSVNTPKTGEVTRHEHLIGTSISMCHYLKDMDMVEGIPITETVHMVCTVNLIEHLSNKKSTSMFFVFPDLGIRSPGKYKLDICLVNVDMYPN
ncbi:hypothetical protein EDD86DRAFT_244921 [Gorgonomyces haynaldii]|nr:hypothetical protein EDD86DRAFT_244921 [Gorgonomyces haynaldii]